MPQRTFDCKTHDLLNQILQEIQSNTTISALPEVCANVDGTPVEINPVLVYTDGAYVSTEYFDAMGRPVTGVITDADFCDCPCEDCDAQEAFDLSGVDKTENTKFNLDDPGFTNAYGDMGTNNWTTADAVAALNAASAGAIPPTVPSGIDYSSTVFGVHPSNPDAIIVVSGPVPTTLDLVSIPVSIPVTSI